MNSLDPGILSRFQRACPATFRALHNRRYLLPQRLQSAYANQDAGIQRRVLTVLGSLLAPDDSFARRAELLSLLASLEFDSPVLFLDSDLAEALMRTSLPEDFMVEDVKFPWGAFKIMLPLGLHLGNKDGDEVQYVDIALCEKDDLIRLDQKLFDDLYAASSQMIFMRRRSLTYLKRGSHRSRKPSFKKGTLARDAASRPQSL